MFHYIQARRAKGTPLAEIIFCWTRAYISAPARGLGTEHGVAQ